MLAIVDYGMANLRSVQKAFERVGHAAQIIATPNGEQEATIHGEAFAIGTLAGAGGIPADFAGGMLLWSGAPDPRLRYAPAMVAGGDRAQG